jgi:hypothetical protein
MRRTMIVMLTAFVVGSTSAGSTALATPNGEHANCQAILSSPDAQRRLRDDIAREFTAADFPPGDIYKLVSLRVVGTTYGECLASLIALLNE